MTQFYYKYKSITKQHQLVIYNIIAIIIKFRVYVGLNCNKSVPNLSIYIFNLFK